MDPQNTPTAPKNTAKVILLEGARDRKPGPEAHVDWPNGLPPGGPLPPKDDSSPQPQPDRRDVNRNPYRKRFLIKIAGAGDQSGELDEEPLTENVLMWLAAELNRDETPLMINQPGTGNRGPKKAALSVTELAGFVAKDSARFYDQGPDGAGLYAEVEVMPDWVALVGAMVNSPAGIDFTAYPPNSVKSVDLVVRPRGTGKVIVELKA